MALPKAPPSVGTGSLGQHWWAMAPGVEPPETKYVAVGDADVAYQVMGDAPLDLLFFSGVGHVEFQWSHPRQASLLTRLASFSRLILFDRRGTGASDAVPRPAAIPTWEEWTDDVAAVLDAVGSERAAIVAQLDAGPIGVLFSAMHPERVTHLILGNTSSRFMVADDYPVGLAPEVVDSLVELIATSWGTADLVRVLSSNATDDEVRFLSQLLRAALTPRTAAAQYRYLLESVDVRHALPLVQSPTLVLHNRGNPIVPFAHGRYIAQHIPGARLVELAYDGVGLRSEEEQVVLEEIAEFLTGKRPVVEVERILTTVLFTDIVRSTERAAALGDQSWRKVLDAHDAVVRDELRRFRGREISTAGDGFQASFDGPARAIRCARAITDAVRKLGIEVRVGIHTGECEVRGDDLAGLTVHIAARVGALAGTCEVLVSGTIRDLVVGSGIEFTDRGEHELKGVPGTWRLFAVGG
jgi:class 3 adenylate cyclase